MSNDVFISQDGTICSFSLQSPEAHAWVAENLPLEGWQWLGANTFAVETRFADDIAEGMMDDGLEVFPPL